MKPGYLVGGLVILTALVFIITQKIVQLPNPVTNTNLVEKLKVVASFYPLGEFAKQVGGDLVDVETITPAGAEPHDYEPTPKQIGDIYASDVFLYNGNGLDSWAEKIAVGLSTEIITNEMSTSINPLIVNDPHFWLDPNLAVDELEVILQILTTADPQNINTYARNFAFYVTALQALADEYATGLADCQQQTIVTSHDAFAYLASEYNFNVVALAGLSPEAEPSAGRLAEVTKLAKDNNIKYIYFETLVSPKLAQTIADEVGAQTLVFNPLEGLTNEELAAGNNYISVMQTNLQNLRTGMICE